MAIEEDILVSICCITYNHEKYVKAALDSFLMQKTNFKYEIIIHDDASTDSTADIIREYEMQYPNIIKPIYQKENQYSKGIKASFLTYQKAKGKYIAMCEGDDYWIDNNKLQKQVEYMEKNEQCMLCFHNAKVYSMKTLTYSAWNYTNKKFLNKDGRYNSGELSLLDFIPTASYMFRKSIVEKIPDWYSECIVGDLPLKLIITSFGYAYYMKDIMSVYRIDTGSSAMDNINRKNKDVNKQIEYWEKIKWILDKSNEFSNFKYDKNFQEAKRTIDKTIIFLKNSDKDILKSKEYRKYLNRNEKIKLILKVYLYPVYNVLKKMRNKYGKK